MSPARSASSEATVSRVLNEKPGVSEATREAVLTALDVLGYERPTKLRGERARLVGLVLPELQNPIFPAFAEVVSGALAQQGYTPVLCTQTAGGVSEADYVELLLQQQVSGVVFAGGLYAQADAPHGHYRRLAERNLPTVLVNAGIDGLGFPRVSCDDDVAVEQAMGHLSLARPHADRPPARAADHMPSRRKLERAKTVADGPGIAFGPDDDRPCALLARGRPGCRRTPAGRAGSPASSVPATRWRSARSGRFAGPACACPTTSRSWVSTTPP